MLTDNGKATLKPTEKKKLAALNSRIYKGHKYFLAGFVEIVCFFGMPLNTKTEMVRNRLYGLYNAIRGSTRYPKAMRNIFYSLMMKRVSEDLIFRTLN